MKNNKKIIISSFSVALLLVAILATSYAFFAANIGIGSTTNVTVTSTTVDSITISPEICSISLVANQDNFGSGAGNLNGSCTHTISLTSSNSSASSYSYDVSFNISSNNFVYSRVIQDTELSLTWIANYNNSSTNCADGTGISLGNADITTKTGNYYLSGGSILSDSPNRYTISADAGKTCTVSWNIAVSFVNKDFDQSVNAGKTFTATININKPTKIS